jgi:hypothetical protein
MSQQGQNVRLMRTQKLLREALVELIDERGFDAITVGELTSRDGEPSCVLSHLPG